MRHGTVLESGNIWDVHVLLSRWHDPKVGRFISYDEFEGSISDPAHLHKYNYGGSDPVNHQDPSGHDFSLTGMMVTGAIAGGLIGFSYGAYKGAQKSGSILSWKTLEYGAIGLVAGAAIGAAAGALIYGAGASLGSLAQIMGRSSWLYDLVVAAHGTRMPVFGLGVLVGFGLGVTDAPGAEGVLAAGAESAMSAVLFAANRTAVANWRSVHPLAQGYFDKVLFRNWANRPVTGYGIARAATFWASWFFAGFTVGYATSKSIVWATDKATDWFDRAERTYADNMGKEMREMDA